MSVLSTSFPAPLVNLEKVFYEKNPRLARLLPGFVFRYLRRIAHEDEINAFLGKHGRKLDMDFIDAVMEDFSVEIETRHEDKIPPKGRYIFVSNHPLGGFDGMVLMKILYPHYREIRFLVNDILMNISNIRNFFIPINKHGSLAMESARMIEEVFASDCQLISFPAGIVSRRNQGVIRDLEWQKNFVQKAIYHKRDVIPVHFSGRNSEFFYRLHRFRTVLGIKANLEMLYLADETFKHRNKTLEVTFGEPIPWQTFDKSKKPAEWAAWVKNKVYELPRSS